MKAMLVKALFADSSTAVDSAMMHESTELALTVKLKALFPLLPDEVLMRMVPGLSNVQRTAACSHGTAARGDAWIKRNK